MTLLKMAVSAGVLAMLIAPAGADEPGTGVGTRTPTGQWLAEDIAGGGVLDRVQTTLVLGPDGATGGRGGCNTYTGSHAFDGDMVTFGPIASTEMACPPAVMNQERKFFDALEKVTAWRLLPEMSKLELLSADGATILVFTAMSGNEPSEDLPR